MTLSKDDDKKNDDKKEDDNKAKEEKEVKEVEEDEEKPKLELSPQERGKLYLRGYKVGAPLGSGSFGTVYRGTFGPKPCAVKMITPKEDELKFVATELYALKNISHIHVTQVFDLFITSKHQLLIFMELAEGGDLWHYIWKENKSVLPECTARLLYRQFGDAFRYMHHLGIAHLDIKAANILLDEEKKVCKVSDFGFAKVGFNRQSGQAKLAKCFRGSGYYVAPEMTGCWLDGTKFSPFKADVWSTGVMLYEMLNRSMPFEYRRVDPVTGKKIKDYECLYESQLKLAYTIANKNLSETGRGIIKAHLEPNPNVRPSFNEILLNDPWLKIEP